MTSTRPIKGLALFPVDEVQHKADDGYYHKGITGDP